MTHQLLVTMEGSTVTTTPPAAATAAASQEEREAAARDASERANFEAIMSEQEYNYSTLEKSHAELLELTRRQQGNIDLLTKELSECQERATWSQSEKEDWMHQIEHERSERIAIAQQSKLDRERLDRANAEADALRDELRRLAETNAHLSAQFHGMETEAKLATSSQMPLRFQLERAKNETEALSAHAKWMEAELVAKSEELEAVKRNLSKQLSLQRMKAASAALEEAECRENIQRMEREKWQERLSQQQEALFRQQTEQSEVIQKLQEALLAEQHLNTLHQGNQEQYKHRISSLEHSLETMTQMAREAEDEQRALEEKILQQSEAITKEICEAKDNEISRLELKVEELQNEKEALEQELEATQQRHLRRRRPALVPEGESEASSTALQQSAPYSLTDLLDRLTEKEEQLSEEIAERRRSELILKKTQLEIEARTPAIRAQRREYELAIRVKQEAEARLEDALVELQRERKHSEEASSSQAYLQKELAWTQRENHDLARQIQSLLRSRMGESPQVMEDNDLIVEIEGVEEMQQQNQKLVREYRRLTDRVTELEQQLDESTLKKALEVAKKELDFLQEERNRQAVLVKGIVQQRDMYKELCGEKETDAQLKLLPSTEEAAKNSSAESNLQEEIYKLQGDLLHTRNENKALQEQASRLDAYASNLASSLSKVQAELLSANSSCARSEAEVEFLKQQCSRLKESLEGAKEEILCVQKDRIELQSINSELERLLTQARGDLSKLETEAARQNAQRRLMEAQLENALQSEKRLMTEADSLRNELGRQGSLLESVHRIESSLLARTTENEQQRNDEIERERKVMAQEAFKQSAELERLQRIAEDLDEKRLSAEQARDIAMKDFLEAKESAINASQNLIDTQARENRLKVKCQELENELATTKASLEAIASSSTNKAKDKKIEHLTTELDSVKGDLLNARERLIAYQKIAKDNEASLAELSKSADEYKVMMSRENDNLKKELEMSNKAAEAKQAALDELGEELTSQRGIQETATKELMSKIEVLTTELEAATKSADASAGRLTIVLEEIELHKANALGARNNYERELALHSEARAELQKVRFDLENEACLRKSIEARLEAVLPECQVERAVFEEQRLILEQQLHEVEARLKEAREQNELFHHQVTALAESVERLRSEKADANKMAADGADFGDGSNQSPDAEENKLRQMISDQRELICSMRSERELLDAQVDSLKQSIERERAASLVVRRSLDEARNEARILREVPPTAENDGKISELQLKLQRSEEQIILLRDSNILLREETDKLKSLLKVSEDALSDVRNAAEPNLKKIRDLEVANVSLEAEKTSLVREVDAWKARVQSLVSRFHPIDPEEHSKALSRAEASEKENETLRNLKAKAEQEASALRSVIARLNKDISHHKDNLDSANRMLNDMKAEKEALIKSTAEAQSLVTNERDNFKGLAESREKQISSLETDVALKTSRLENLTNILRRQKQMLADAQKTQTALQKKVQDQEELIKRQADVFSDKTKNTEQAKTNNVTESPPETETNKDVEKDVAKQPSFDASQPAVEAVSVPDGGFRFAASKETVFPLKDNDVSASVDAIEQLKDKIAESPITRSELHLIQDNKPITMEVDPESLQQEKESQQDEGLSDANMKPQVATNANEEALETLRDKLMKKKRLLKAAMAANKEKAQSMPLESTQPALQPNTSSQTEDPEPPSTAIEESEAENKSVDVPTIVIPEPPAEQKVNVEENMPTAELFGSKSTEEFQAAPFSFGSSSSITLPIPTILPTSPSPFGAFSVTFGGTPGGSTLAAAPLFSESRKRTQPDDSEPEKNETAVKQARIDVDAKKDEPGSSTQVED